MTMEPMLPGTHHPGLDWCADWVRERIPRGEHTFQVVQLMDPLVHYIQHSEIEDVRTRVLTFEVRKATFPAPYTGPDRLIYLARIAVDNLGRQVAGPIEELVAVGPAIQHDPDWCMCPIDNDACWRRRQMWLGAVGVHTVTRY